MKKIIFFGLKTIGIALTVFLIIGFFFVGCSPQFGGKITHKQKVIFSKSKNYSEGKFVNKEETRTSPNFKELRLLIKEYSKEHPNTEPIEKLPVLHIDSTSIVSYTRNEARVVWFGHSAFLLQLNGKNILIDPMFGDVPAPHPWLGSERFSNGLPIEIEQLPQIDAVVISHDHYDHLDYETIKKLKDKVSDFYTPLGVGVHLQKWGVSIDRIHELDWWQDIAFDNLLLTCTPARHFSGRGLSDSRSTLWCSWVIKSKTENIFFSGDSGYGTHFKEIGKRYGPFDFALMECGQYSEKFRELPIHMLPEETAQASIDIQTKKVMPVHWGSFKLSTHPWNEPVERLTQRLNKTNIELITPQIGEYVYINDINRENYNWWKLIK
jgi:L-ascorbate metabolism protein UlaG (beta-lactamase superfamily)